MVENQLEEIYEKIIYPSKDFQKMLRTAEKRTKEVWTQRGLPQGNYEEYFEIFQAEEEKLRQEVFLSGVRYGCRLAEELEL